MSFMDAVKAVLTNYVGFSGRARRSEYWWFILFTTIVSVIFQILGNFASFFGIVGTLVNLAFLLPSIAAGVRRMHDTGRSGWWIIVPIANIIFAVQDSQPGQNQFGPNPKDGSATAVAA